MRKSLNVLIAVCLALFIGSSVYAVSFTEQQSILTTSARDWESFTIGDDSYIALARYYDGSSYTINSIIYKWDDTTSQFTEFQTIATTGAVNWEAFTIGDDVYLAVANHYNGSTNNVSSKIYKWNGSTFEQFQTIATIGAVDWEAFTIGDDVYLAVANYYNGSTYSINSTIYKWNATNTQFEVFQSIVSNGAVDWESFTIGDDIYLAVANECNGSTYSINSTIYKWNATDTQFEVFQSIATNAAMDWESFTIGDDVYLAVANYCNDSTHNIDSTIYKWNATDTQFKIFQSIPTNSADNWKSFTIGSAVYLAVANFYDGSSFNINSKIYKWNGSQFNEFQSIATNGARDWEYFTIGSDIYLSVANYYDVNSKIYKFDLPSITELTTTPDPASGDIPLTVDFTITVTGGTSPYTYSWDFDGDSVADSTDQNPSYTYTTAGSYTATVTVTDDDGTTATDSVSVSVDQPLSIDSYSATPSTGFTPLDVAFSVTATGGTSPYTYSWDFDDDGVEDSTEQNPEYTYTSAYSGNAVITVTDDDSNSVSQTIALSITELTSADCYATYDFINNEFIVPCFEFDGVLYKIDMTLQAGDPYAFEVNSILAK